MVPSVRGKKKKKENTSTASARRGRKGKREKKGGPYANSSGPKDEKEDRQGEGREENLALARRKEGGEKGASYCTISEHGAFPEGGEKKKKGGGGNRDRFPSPERKRGRSWP